MRLIDADELAHALDYDVELCAKALDDMAIVGKAREDMQFEKDCKQNCIWYISEQPTIEAIPVDWIKEWLITFNGLSDVKGSFAIRMLLDDWEEKIGMN